MPGVADSRPLHLLRGVPAAGAAAGRLVPAAVLVTTAVRLAVTAVYEWTASDVRRIEGEAGAREQL